MEKYICLSCGKEITNKEGSIIFECPRCGSLIVRCRKCRETGKKYKCKNCDFEGP